MKLSALCSTWNPSSWTVREHAAEPRAGLEQRQFAAGIEFHQPMRSRQAGDAAADHGDASGREIGRDSWR